jgi:hypothetical protein
MVDFTPFHASRNHKDGCIYNLPRKQYTRTHPAPKYGYKIPFYKNEKACMIKLRKLGYPINQIAQFTGRSFSIVHKVLAIATERLGMRKLDARCGNTNANRLKQSARRWRIFEAKYMQGWLAFVEGSQDKPP